MTNSVSRSSRPSDLHAEYGLKKARSVSRLGLFAFQGPTLEERAKAARDALPDANYLVDMLVEMGHSSEIREAENDLARDLEIADGRSTLRSYRLRSGFSQDALAALLSTSQARISKIEHGKEEMGLLFAGRLAKILKVSLDDIYAAVTVGKTDGC